MVDLVARTATLPEKQSPHAEQAALTQYSVSER
jgi:hypothetical protein